MDLGDISRRFDNLLGSARRRTKPVDEALEDMEEVYDESIESIDEMLRWLNYYSRDPENPQYEPIGHGSTEFKLTSLNNEVDDAPKLVRKPYVQYRKENPLLTGEENTINMMESSFGSNKWTRFCRQVKKHKKFLEELKSTIKEGRGEVQDAKDELQRQEYNKKAMDQRGEKTTVDREEIIPDRTPGTVREEIAEKLEDRLQDEREEQEDEDNEEETDPNMMTPRQFVHFIVMHLKYSRGERSDYYRTLKNSFPEQSEKIESEIYTLSDIERIGRGDDELVKRPLSDKEKEYVRERVNEDGEISETLERHKETA